MHAASGTPHWIDLQRNHSIDAAQDPGGLIGRTNQPNEMAFERALLLGTSLTGQLFGSFATAAGLPCLADVQTAASHEEMVPGVIQTAVSACSPELGDTGREGADVGLVRPGEGPAGIAVSSSIVASALQLYSAAACNAHRGGIKQADAVSARAAAHGRQALDALCTQELLNSLDRTTCGAAVQPVAGALKHLLGTTSDTSVDACNPASHHLRGRSGAGVAAGAALTRSIGGPHPPDRPLLVWSLQQARLVPAESVFCGVPVPSLGARLGTESSHRAAEIAGIARNAVFGLDGSLHVPGHTDGKEIVSEAGVESTRRASIAAGGSSQERPRSASAYGAEAASGVDEASADARCQGIQVSLSSVTSAKQAVASMAVGNPSGDGVGDAGAAASQLAGLMAVRIAPGVGDSTSSELDASSIGVRQAAAGISTAAGALRAG